MQYISSFTSSSSPLSSLHTEVGLPHSFYSSSSSYSTFYPSTSHLYTVPPHSPLSSSSSSLLLLLLLFIIFPPTPPTILLLPISVQIPFLVSTPPSLHHLLHYSHSLSLSSPHLIFSHSLPIRASTFPGVMSSLLYFFGLPYILFSKQLIFTLFKSSFFLCTAFVKMFVSFFPYVFSPCL